MKILFLATLFIASCARINPQEQAHYAQQSQLRHGLIPLDNVSVKEIPKSELSTSIARGRALYEQDCQRCHGATGLGDGPASKDLKVPAADLQAAVKEVPHFKLYLSISQWEGKMPGWKTKHSAEDLDNLAAYLKTFR